MNRLTIALGLSLLAVLPANAEIVKGILKVRGAEMP
jgi:hypothetical protein